MFHLLQNHWVNTEQIKHFQREAKETRQMCQSSEILHQVTRGSQRFITAVFTIADLSVETYWPDDEAIFLKRYRPLLQLVLTLMCFSWNTVWTPNETFLNFLRGERNVYHRTSRSWLLAASYPEGQTSLTIILDRSLMHCVYALWEKVVSKQV